MKLSGEALEGKDQSLSPQVLDRIAKELKEVTELGVELAIVIGGGNLFRGMTLAASGMDRTTADTMGMLATIMNCLGMQDALMRSQQPAVVMSAIPVMQVCDPFTRRAALAHLQEGTVVLLAGGTGNPFFSTDTAAALRALEIGADALFKATKVDGIYDKDPVKHRDARRYVSLNYRDVIEKRLQVMDATAVTLCRDNRLPMVVFDLGKERNVRKALCGESVGTRVAENCESLYDDAF